MYSCSQRRSLAASSRGDPGDDAETEADRRVGVPAQSETHGAGGRPPAWLTTRCHAMSPRCRFCAARRFGDERRVRRLHPGGPPDPREGPARPPPRSCGLYLALLPSLAHRSDARGAVGGSGRRGSPSPTDVGNGHSITPTARPFGTCWAACRRHPRGTADAARAASRGRCSAAGDRRFSLAARWPGARAARDPLTTPSSPPGSGRLRTCAGRWQ